MAKRTGGERASRTCELVSVAKMKHETENELKVMQTANSCHDLVDVAKTWGRRRSPPLQW
jgi:hypothetical protein